MGLQGFALARACNLYFDRWSGVLVNTRPVFLDLGKMRFPIMAIASILHRISGFVLFLFIIFILWALHCSLHSEQGFASVQALFALAWMKVIIWLFVSALIYHLLAGVRHLLMDLGLGETLAGARMTAWSVIISSIVLAICLGVYLW